MPFLCEIPFDYSIHLLNRPAAYPMSETDPLVTRQSASTRRRRELYRKGTLWDTVMGFSKREPRWRSFSACRHTKAGNGAYTTGYPINRSNHGAILSSASGAWLRRISTLNC